MQREVLTKYCIRLPVSITKVSGKVAMSTCNNIATSYFFFMILKALLSLFYCFVPKTPILRPIKFKHGFRFLCFSSVLSSLLSISGKLHLYKKKSYKSRYWIYVSEPYTYKRNKKCTVYFSLENTRVTVRSIRWR